MSTIEESIQRCTDALIGSVRSVQIAKEISDPVEFDKSLIAVLENRNVTLENIYAGTPYESEVSQIPEAERLVLESTIRDYIELKDMMRQGHAAGYELNWDIDAILSANQSLSLIAGTQMAGYNSLCTTLLAHELIAITKTRELSQAEVLDDMGAELINKKRYDEALPFLDESIRLSPKFSLAWINKGIALKNSGRIDEAIACYDHVINNIDSKYKKAWGNKANALLTIGEYESALSCVDKALIIDPNYGYARMLEQQLR